MSAVTAYVFEGNEVRVVTRDGEPWFVAADVCRVLGVQNVAQAVGPLDEDEKGICKTYTPGGAQQMLTVSEGGLYTLVLRSQGAVTRGSVAHRFRKWVTGEVLPAIRKTGRYEAPAARASLPEVRAADTAVQMVAECRRIHGIPAARALWAELGLPGAKALPDQVPDFVRTGHPIADAWCSRIVEVLGDAGGKLTERTKLMIEAGLHPHEMDYALRHLVGVVEEVKIIENMKTRVFFRLARAR